MPDLFAEKKRENLERRLTRLCEEYDALNEQLDRTLSANTEVRLKREIKELEKKIDGIRQELSLLEEETTESEDTTKNNSALKALIVVIITLLFIVFAYLISYARLFSTGNRDLNSTPTLTTKSQDLVNSKEDTRSASQQEMRFIVMYPGQDGLSLRRGPSKSYAEIAVLNMGIELVVRGEPTREKETDIRWWPVSNSSYGDGWVAESIPNWRLIKPKLANGEIVEVLNPGELHQVILPNSNCTSMALLNLGKELTVLKGPETKCETQNYFTRGQGRQWWYVTTSNGMEGWITDLSENNEALLIAPQWYFNLSKIPRIYNFRACSFPCKEGETFAFRTTFPEGTKKISVFWNYENIPKSADYVRTWTVNGTEWVRYDCTWLGPETGVEDRIVLTEDKGLYSGTWEVSIAVNDDILLREQIFVEGDWHHWAPPGQRNKCYE